MDLDLSCFSITKAPHMFNTSPPPPPPSVCVLYGREAGLCLRCCKKGKRCLSLSLSLTFTRTCVCVCVRVCVCLLLSSDEINTEKPVSLELQLGYIRQWTKTAINHTLDAKKNHTLDTKRKKTIERNFLNAVLVLAPSVQHLRKKSQTRGKTFSCF